MGIYFAKSPWRGGCWERLVQTVKRSMRKTLKKAKLSYEELQTVVTEIEGEINSRPLCYQYSDSFEEVLTPSHLMHGRRLLSRQENTECNDTTPKTITKRIKYLNLLLENFERTWKKQYLTELRDHQTVRNNAPDKLVQVSRVLLIVENNIPRSR